MDNEDPTTRIITLEELGTHSTKQDAWMALRGKVFDVTFYIEQHPGGVSTIIKAIGKDGTEMFDSVHSYVHFEDILAGKQVGILEVSQKQYRESIFKEKEKALLAKLNQKRVKTKRFCGCCGGHTEGYPDTDMYESTSSIAYTVTFHDAHNSQETDWTVGIKDQKVLTVRKVIGHSDVWLAQLRLTERLTNDTIRVQFENNYNAMEVTLKKPTPGIKWKNIGTPEGSEHNQIVDSRSTDESFEACIVHKQQLTDNVYLFGMQLKTSVRYGIPIGFHLHIRVGTDQKQAYTPTCYSMIGEEEPKFGDGQLIWFIIKIYPKGHLTKQLHAIAVEHTDDSHFPLRLGTPMGLFEMENLMDKESEVMILFAGGTGITPFTRIIRWYYDEVRRSGGYKHVILMFWNKTEEDIIWKEQWRALDDQESWFHFHPVLTSVAPNSDWEGLKGHATNAIIQGAMDSLPFEISSPDHIQGMICGPVGFNSSIEEALKGILNLDKVHIFAG